MGWRIVLPARERTPCKAAPKTGGYVWFSRFDMSHGRR
jgi:hypothetical protein